MSQKTGVSLYLAAGAYAALKRAAAADGRSVANWLERLVLESLRSGDSPAPSRVVGATVPMPRQMDLATAIAASVRAGPVKAPARHK